jgi:hypothetical protein
VFSVNKKRFLIRYIGCLVLVPLVSISFALLTSSDFFSYNLGFFLVATKGTVTESRVIKDEARSARKVGLVEDHFEPIVRFTFRVNETDFIGTKAKMLGSSYVSELAAQRIASRFSTGQKVDVFYRVNSPQSALLDVSFPWSLVAGGGLIGGGLGVLMLLASAFKPSLKRSTQ